MGGPSISEPLPRVVLLRGIGPVSHACMTMKALEAACRAGGLPDTVSILATGNLVIRSPLPTPRVEQTVLALLAGAGFPTAAVTADAARLAAMAALCPDPEAAASRPSQVQVTFLDQPLSDGALGMLRERAGPERVERIGTDLWIDYRGPIAPSRLTLPVITRATGGVATARNWNTVLKLAAAVGDPPGPASAD